MGFKPSPYLTTNDICHLEPILKGDRHLATNPFRWKSVELNLPGDPGDTPALPWVYKAQDNGAVAGDLFSYIDDLRNCQGDMDECWKDIHQVYC